jgi:signal transduction histidine kinase
MRDVTPLKGGSRASRREAIHLPPGQRVLGAVLQNIISERTPLGVLPGAHGLEWSIDNEDALDTSYLLRQARLRVEELAASNRRKDEFMAMLGHELRNPLASISNGIHLLKHQTQETPARQKTQAMIERQVRRMTQLVQDILDVSRITQGRLHVQRERIDLRDVVSNAIETVQSDIQQRNHRLTTTLPDAPVWLQGDPGRLEQVFVNLLANASRYTDVGGEVAVRVQARNAQAIVRILDSGIGIAPEVLPHLFDLFRQADEAAPHSQSGLGIGLALVRDLVESHGGSVMGESAGRGRGSEFTVCLPRELDVADVTDGVTNTAFR